MFISVLGQNTKRESGRKVQSGNINAAKTIADIIRTCLGPKSMMKMLLDSMGGIVMINDGNAILREVCSFVFVVLFPFFSPPFLKFL